MADEIKLQIILEDGSVKQGFLSVEKQAKQTGKKVGEAFDKKDTGLNTLAESLETATSGLSGMASVLKNTLGTTGIFGAAAVGAALGLGKLALAGEQVNAINSQFENIARSSGLAVDSFKESIIGATKGLIDDEDALQIATKGIIALGDEAKRLPQILDASRSVSKALGKDFKDTFGDLSSFVETGNARILRQFGIVLDLEKAYAAAAKSIGVASSALTEQQKQTIRANELLEKIPQRFSAAADSVTPLKDAFDRLKVSTGNFFESIASGFAKSFTKTFIDNADLSNVGITRLRQNLKDTQDQILSVNKTIEEIKLDKLASKSVGAASQISSLNDRLKELKKEQSLISSAIEDQREVERKLEGSRKASPSGDADNSLKITPEQARAAREAELKRLNELQAYVSAQDKIVLDAEIKRVQGITNLNDKLTAQQSIFTQQSILLEQQKNTTLSQVDAQFSTDKGFSQLERDQARLATIQNFYTQEQALAKQNADAIKLIEDAKNFNVLSGFQTMSMGFNEAAIEFSNNAVANFKEVGKQAFNSLGRGVGNAFAAFGQALASGEDAGKAFLQSMLGLFADVAIQLGTSFIMQGIAHSLNPLTPGLGGPLITAGAALATFGGVLKGMSGGKSSTQQQDTGGGIGAAPSTSTELTTQENLERQEVGTSVQVTIQGDVLDSDESGSRIVNLINQAFDKKGVVINQGVTA